MALYGSPILPFRYDNQLLEDQLEALPYFQPIALEEEDLQQVNLTGTAFDHTTQDTNYVLQGENLFLLSNPNEL